jgi:tripartite motif-containing protein 71
MIENENNTVQVSDLDAHPKQSGSWIGWLAQPLWRKRRVVGPVGLVGGGLLLLWLCLFPVLLPAHPVPGGGIRSPRIDTCRYPPQASAVRVALVGIAVTSQGHVYMADLGSDRMREIDPGSGRTERAWGCLGGAEGQFDLGLNEGSGVALDRTGNIYVADTDNSRIQRFDPTGHFLLSWSSPFSQFFSPVAVAVDKQGEVYVVDFFNARIEVFDRTGHFLFAWGGPGSGDGQFSLPDGIAVDGLGHVYVADRGNNRVETFDSTGHFLAAWGIHRPGIGGSASPTGIAVDADNNIYVVAQATDCSILKITPFGTVVDRWKC